MSLLKASKNNSSVYGAEFPKNVCLMISPGWIPKFIDVPPLSSTTAATTASEDALRSL
jgi:hypothetical protein